MMIKEVYAAVDIEKEYDFGDVISLGQGIDRLVLPAFSIATAAVVIYFLVAAFKLVSAGSDKDALEGAKNMITHAIIGFLLLFLAFAILQFIPYFFGLRVPLI